MTDDQKELVRGSFAKVADEPEGVAAVFYARLFELDPNLRPLFTGDMRVQGRKLMLMLGTAVKNLHAIDTILPAVRQLGARHLGYRVEDAHYEVVGDALLWTLSAGLKDEFTPAVREAWTTCYVALANVMKSGAHDAAKG